MQSVSKIDNTIDEDASAEWYVLTGGPATGKTTLLRELASRGHDVVHEPARQVILRGLEQGKTLEAIRGNSVDFFAEIHEMEFSSLAIAQANTKTFFDRSFIDSIGYMNLHGIKPTERHVAMATKRYFRKIFLLDMLPYVQDEVRNEDEHKAKEIHKVLRETYISVGYDVIDVPILPVSARADFVLKLIE